MNIPLVVRYQVLGTGWKSPQGTFQVSLSPQPAWSSAQSVSSSRGGTEQGHVPVCQVAGKSQHSLLKPKPVCSGPHESFLATSSPSYPTST